MLKSLTVCAGISNTSDESTVQAHNKINLIGREQRSLSVSFVLPWALLYGPDGMRKRHLVPLLPPHRPSMPTAPSITSSLGSHVVVAECKGFATWGVLFKNERWMWQGSFIYLQQVKDRGFIAEALPPRREA